MKTCRCGYALLEMLSILVAVAVLMMLSVEPMRTMLSEIPKTDRDYQTWSVTRKMLRQLRDDVEAASAMRLDETDAQGSTLDLVRASGTVQYRLMDEKAVRMFSPVDGMEPIAVEWALPKNRMQVSLWAESGRPTALEVTTWVEQHRGPRKLKNFEQTSVFFRKSQ